MDSKLKLLYDSANQYFELGDFDSFKSKMANPEKRKLLYDNASQIFELGDYDSFARKILPEVSIPPIGYTTESIQNLIQAKRDKQEDVTLKVQDVHTLAGNLKNVALVEAEPSSTIVPQQLGDMAHITKPRAKETVMFETQPEMETIGAQAKYVPTRVLSAVVEKPAYGMTELGFRGVKLLSDITGFGKGTNAYKFVEDAVDFYSQPEKYGVFTPYAEKMRSYLTTKNYNAGYGWGLLTDLAESGTDITALLLGIKGVGAVGKIGTGSALAQADLTQPNISKEIGTQMKKLGLWGFTTTSGDVSDRLQASIHLIGYSITPYIVGATGLTGWPATGSDILLNTFLSSPTYIQAYKQAGGINREFISSAIPQFVSDVAFAWNTKGLPENIYKKQLAKEHANRTKELNIPLREYDMLIRTMQQDVSDVTEKKSGVVVNEQNIPVFKVPNTELQTLYQKQADLYTEWKAEPNPESPDVKRKYESQLNPLTDQINRQVYGKPNVEAEKVDTKTALEESGLILPENLSAKIKSDKVQELEKQYSKTESILKRVKKPETKARLEKELENISSQIEIELGDKVEPEIPKITPEKPVEQQTPETKAEMPIPEVKPAEGLKSTVTELNKSGAKIQVRQSKKEGEVFAVGKDAKGRQVSVEGKPEFVEKTLTEQKPISDKYYNYIAKDSGDREYTIDEKAKPYKSPTRPDLDLYIHKDIDGIWDIAEGKTGRSLAKGNTQASAKERAESTIKLHADRIDETLQLHIEKNGLSPRYKATEPQKPYFDRTEVKQAEKETKLKEKQVEIPVGEGVQAGVKPTEKEEYKGQHRPMTVEGGAARLDDLTSAFGEDIYSKDAVQIYGSGGAGKERILDNQTVRILQSIRGMPEKEITVYRAIPKNEPSSKLTEGDWVTINRQYAKEHGEGILGGDYKIIEQKVKVKDLTTNPDSFHEQGYYPAEQPRAEAVKPSSEKPSEPTKIKSYGYDIFKMGKNLSIEELQSLRENIETDPSNKNPEGSFHIYKPAARKKLENITWAISNKLRRQKLVEAKPSAEPVEISAKPVVAEKPKKLTADLRHALSEIELLKSTVARYDKDSKSPGLAQGKKDEIRLARKEALRRIDYLNKKFNLGGGEFNIQLFPGAKAFAKWVESKLPKSDASLVEQLLEQQNELNKYYKTLPPKSSERYRLDQELQSISDNINKICKGLKPSNEEISQIESNIVANEKAERNKLLAKAHIIEKNKKLSPIKIKNIKKKIFGSETLTDATDKQISTYIKVIENNGKFSPDKKPTIRKTLQKQIIDMPDRTIEEKDAYIFKNNDLRLESQKKQITTKLTETKWIESLQKFKGMFRWREAIQRKTGVDIYDRGEYLRTTEGLKEKHYNDILNKLPNEYHKLNKAERESITDWLADPTVKITRNAQKVGQAFKDVWYDTDLAKLILKVNRFQEWLINPAQVNISGVSKLELQRLKTIWLKEGDLALIDAIKDVKGFTIEKNYRPDLNAIDELPLYLPIGVGKGLLQSKTGGAINIERDAVKAFNRKLRSDLKILYLNDAIRSMNELTGDNRLPESVRRDITSDLRNYLYRDESFIGEKVGSMVVRAALTTPKNWFRDVFQRFHVLSYTRPADIPKRTYQLIGSMIRTGKINIDKTKSWKFAPQFVKNYFETRVSESSAINHEFMGMASHPWLSRMGKIGEVAKQILRTSGKIDNSNRWSIFAPIYKDTRLALESGKPFNKIKQRIYWEHLSGELKKLLLPEIDNKNYDYVALRIAEEITSGKTQWRYGLHEKSVHEQKPVWHFLLRVTTYSRSNIESIVDDVKTLGNGIAGRDVKQFYAGFQAIVGRLAIQYAIGEFIVQPILGKRKEYGYGTDIMEVFDPELGGIANSVIGFYGNLEEPLVDIGDNLIKRYVEGDFDEEEFEKEQSKAIKKLIKSADTITYATTVGYRQMLWMLESIYGIDKIKPFTDAYNTVIKDKDWDGRHIERDAWEILRHTLFGTDTKETLEKNW